MAERFQKIPGTQKISESYGVIDQNFEQLDNELSAIEQRFESLDTLSPADRAKLDGIEEGAQVNQNAFAKVNDLEASDPSDAVTITGGTGITTTTNPNTKEVIITATGEATPGPHGSAHLEFGSDPIPYATETTGGLMTAEDKQKLTELEGLPDEVSELKSATVTDVANVVTGFGADPSGATDSSTAFANAAASKKRIEVPEGTYLVGDVDLSGVYVFGKGTIRKKADAECAFHVKGDGTIIEGLFFDAMPTTGQPSTDIKLGEGARNVRIYGCTFRSKIYSAIAAAVDTISGGEPYDEPVCGVIISHNVFAKRDEMPTGYARPLHLHSVNNVTITGNIIRDTGYDAIRLRENDGFVLIDSNQFINIGDPSWPDIQTRDAIDTYWSGANLTITNNLIDTTAFNGIEVKGWAPDGSYGSRKIIIAHNQIRRTRFSGIFLAGDSDYDGQGNYKFIDSVIIANNIVEECNQNNASGQGSVGESAIYLKHLCRFVTISENIVKCNFGRGIYLANTEPGKAVNHDIKIINNTCLNNGSDGVATSSGIHVDVANNVDVVGNTCSNVSDLPNPHQSVGIWMVFSSPNYTSDPRTWRVKDNRCHDNLTNPFTFNPANERFNGVADWSGNIFTGPNTGQFRGAWMYHRNILFGLTPPTEAEGEFQRGDIIFNANPSAGGILGWVCVSGGSPGTWKTIGSIED